MHFTLVKIIIRFNPFSLTPAESSTTEYSYILQD